MEMRHKPWERIQWNQVHQQKMYRDWGVTYSKKQQFDNARFYYNKALDLQEDDVTALYYRSLCHDDVAENDNALEDALKACDIEDMNHLVNLQVCDAYYNANMFESCKTELCAKMKKFTGWKVKSFQERIDIVDQNCYDCLGDYAGDFLAKNSKYLPTVLELWHKVEDKRPLWKIQREQEKCDIVSVLEEETKDTSPLEMAKKHLYFKVFNQIYFQKGWIDVVFIRDLLNNKSLLLPQTKKSTPFIEKILKEDYSTLVRFLKMLHARNPVYTQRNKMCPDQKLAAKTRESHLYRLQYQTRRDMFNILANMKRFRAKGDLNGMIKFVEDRIGNYTAIKTKRILPRKFEFINEIYNIVALTYIDSLTIPSNIDNHPLRKKLEVIMRLPLEKEEEQQVKRVTFGDKSTYRQPNAQKSGFGAYKKLIDILEHRLKFVEYSIEKCYIYHEISRRHLDRKKFEGALTLAKKIIEEAQSCKNYAWMFVGELQIARIHTAQKEVLLTEKSLKHLLQITKKLNNQKLMDYVKICKTFSSMLLRMRLLQSGSLMLKSKSDIFN